MTADASPRVPPVPDVRVVDAVRRRLSQHQQKMVPAPTNILEMMTGLGVSQAMYVATELGIPDELGAGPQSADAIAERVDAA
jgi:hypothetical protein